MSDNPLVYSTDSGRIKVTPTTTPISSGDGFVRIRRETKGRKGKGVCVICGLAMDPVALKALCSQLKKRCGTGGAVKNGDIEIQGDNRELIKTILEAQGHKVKFAGG